MKRNHHGIFSVLLIYLVSGHALCVAGEIQDLGFLIQGIRTYDEMLQDIEVTMTWERPGEAIPVTSTATRWGKQGLQEYIDVDMLKPDSEAEEGFRPYKKEFRFNGQRLTARNKLVGRGVIRDLAPSDFDTFLHPWHFLGGQLTTERNPLSTFLVEEATGVSIVGHEEDSVIIEGHYLSEPDNPQWQFPKSFKIWIDTARQFRPARIEVHDVIRGQDVVTLSLTDIELEEIDGLYLPMRGDRTVWDVSVVPEDGYTMEELQSLPREEAKRHLRVETSPMRAPWRMIVTSIRVNQGIPADRFTVAFPSGSRVWDSFLRTSITWE